MENYSKFSNAVRSRPIFQRVPLTFFDFSKPNVRTYVTLKNAKNITRLVSMFEIVVNTLDVL